MLQWLRNTCRQYITAFEPNDSDIGRILRERRIQDGTHRLFPLLAFILLSEGTNLLVNSTRYSSYKYGAVFLFTSVCFVVCSGVFLISLYWLSRNPQYRAPQRLAVSLSFWGIYTILALVSASAEILEKGSINNLIILVIAACIIPLWPPKTSCLFFLLCMAIGLVAAFLSGNNPYLYGEIPIICIIAWFAGMYLYRERLQAYAKDVNLQESHKALRQANQRLQELSETDDLTMLYNRRGMKARVDLIWDLCARNRQNIGVLMIDIDLFKNFNDLYGHGAGDAYLTHVADCIRSIARRATDICVRYGGEEFLVVINSIPVESLIQMAVSLKDKVASIKCPTPDGYGFMNSTVSIGIGNGIPSSTTTFTELINEADQAMYNAKQSGRNCVSYREDVYR